MTKFVMCFQEHCVLSSYWYDKGQGFESVTCLYSNPLTWRRRSASCFGDFAFHRHLEICLQNGSILCIFSRVCSLSPVSGFSVPSSVSLTVVISGVIVSALGGDTITSSHVAGLNVMMGTLGSQPGKLQRAPEGHITII